MSFNKKHGSARYNIHLLRIPHYNLELNTSEVTNYVNKFKAENGALTPEFKAYLQHWYNKDKGKNIIENITEMLCEIDTSASL